MTKTPHAPYENFSIKEEIIVDGWRFRSIMKYVEEQWGDAYIIAPDGSRAGIVWVVGSGNLETLIPPESDRWGVYRVFFQEPMKNVADLTRNFKSVLPELIRAYENAVT